MCILNRSMNFHRELLDLFVKYEEELPMSKDLHLREIEN